MFLIDRDRLQLCWSDGDEDLAHALMAVEGFVVALEGRAQKFRVLGGWERRIELARGLAARHRERKSRRRDDEASA